MTDFSELLTQEDHDRGAEINILHPVTKKTTNIFIKVAGIDSKRWMESKNKVTKSLAGLSEKEIKEFDTHELAISCLAHATMGWRGVTSDDKELPFSLDKCKELYRGSPYVYSQVNKFIEDRANFTKG